MFWRNYDLNLAFLKIMNLMSRLKKIKNSIQLSFISYKIYEEIIRMVL